MVHHYAAGMLGLLVLVLVGLAWWCPRHRMLMTILAGLILFQVQLGMWMVTMKLMPLVVTGHHLGGMSVLALLWWVLLDNRYRQQIAHGMVQATEVPSKLQLFTGIGLGLLVLQILLGWGGSTSDAGLACTSYPSCNGQWWSLHADYANGFSLHDVDAAGLVAIQWAHRLGALIVFFYLGVLAILCRSVTPRISLAIGVFLLLQLSLSIGAVLSGLLLPMEDANNAVAALLLMSVIALVHRLNHGLSYSRVMVSKAELS